MRRRALGLETEIDLLPFILENGKWKFEKDERLNAVLIDAVLRCHYEKLWSPPNRRYYFSGNFLKDGSRLYQDGASIELATPECFGVDALATYEKTTEVNLIETLVRLNKNWRFSAELSKKTTDLNQPRGNGSHENYYFEIPADWKGKTQDYKIRQKLGDILTAFLISRGTIAGCGHLDNRGNFLISPRLSLVNRITGVGANRDRGKSMFFIRNEESGEVDYKNYKRIQICSGDANMSSFCTRFRFGTTHLVLRMVEENFLEESPTPLKDNVGSAHKAAYDVFLNKKYDLANGATAGALEIQEKYLELANAFFKTRSMSGAEREILKSWEETIKNLKNFPSLMDKLIDGRILYNYFSFLLREKYGMEWGDLKAGLNPRLALDDARRHQKAKKINKELQTLLSRYFWLIDNRLWRLLKETGFLDESLKAPQDFIEAPERFRSPAGRPRWRSSIINLIERLDLPVKADIKWGNVTISNLKLPGQIIMHENHDPFNGRFSEKEFLESFKNALRL